MSSSTLLDVAFLDPAQLSKSYTVNAAVQALEAALAQTLSIDASTKTSPYVLPYDGTQDEPVGTKTALRFMRLQITGTLAADWIAEFPSGKKKMFFAVNSTGGSRNVTLRVTGQAGIQIKSGEAVLCYLNGIDIEKIAITPTNVTGAVEIRGFQRGVPAANDFLLRHITTQPFMLPPGLGGSSGNGTANATGSPVYTIHRNGTQIGTMTISAGTKVASFSMAGTAVFNVGDVLDIQTPASPDATLANMAVVLVAAFGAIYLLAAGVGGASGLLRGKAPISGRATGLGGGSGVHS